MLLILPILKLSTRYFVDSLYSKLLEIEKSLNSALPKSQNLSIYYFVRYVFISISAPLGRLFSLGCQKYYLDPNIMEFSFFLFKEMHLFPLIPSILTKISILVLGIEILLIVF